MDFEERIQRLTERHEALTQSLELTRLQQAEDAENIRQLAKIAVTALDSIRALERIAESH
jgi:hypothetical protein